MKTKCMHLYAMCVKLVCQREPLFGASPMEHGLTSYET